MSFKECFNELFPTIKSFDANMVIYGNFVLVVKNSNFIPKLAISTLGMYYEPLNSN